MLSPRTRPVWRRVRRDRSSAVAPSDLADGAVDLSVAGDLEEFAVAVQHEHTANAFAPFLGSQGNASASGFNFGTNGWRFDVPWQDDVVGVQWRAQTFKRCKACSVKLRACLKRAPKSLRGFRRRVPPEWQQYNNYYEMQKMIQRASLLQELDQRLNPISPESRRDSSASSRERLPPSQMRDVTEDVYTPTVTEGHA